MLVLFFEFVAHFVTVLTTTWASLKGPFIITEFQLLNLCKKTNKQKNTVTPMPPRCTDEQLKRQNKKKRTTDTRRKIKGRLWNQSAVPQQRSKLESSVRPPKQTDTATKTASTWEEMKRGHVSNTNHVSDSGKAECGVNGLGTPQKQLLLPFPEWKTGVKRSKPPRSDCTFSLLFE